MRFMQRSLMGLFLLALTLGVLAIAGLSVRDAVRERLANKAPARPVRERVFSVNVLLAERQSATPVIETFGEIRSRRALDIRAPLAGTVVFLAPDFIEGGAVSKGELLLRLDPADAKSALQSVKTDAAEAANELRQAGAALALARDDVDGARAQRALRSRALERQQGLVARGFGTDAAVEAAALSEAAAKQLVLAKRQALAQAEARLTRAKTALARLDLRLQDARRRLADTQVFAEFDGVLSAVNVIKGGLVGPNEKLARLIDPDALEVAFRVSNIQFARLGALLDSATRGKVLVRLDVAGDTVSANGTIERVSAEVGTGQTGRQIFARLSAKADTGFRPGDFVSVTVDEPPLTNVYVLPARAVDHSGSVLVLGENDRLEAVGVTVLRRQQDKVIVRAEGLEGREVVATRTPLLGEGIRVKPLRNKVDATLSQAPDLIALTPERRAKLVGFVSTNKSIPKDARARILARLKMDRVPAEMVTRIEKRMGG